MKIAPSILNADFGHLADVVKRAEAGGADWIHVDVMDGQFVPNITLGPMIVEAIRSSTSLPLDVHMMVQQPARFVEPFIHAGASWVTIHLEADTHPHRTLEAIRAAGAHAGLALNPGTPVSHAQDLVAEADMLLIMSVNPGFGGQEFIPAALRKLRQARELIDRCNAPCELEVDGGVKLANAPEIAQAGTTVVVAGSFVYTQGEVESNIRALRQALS
ncbi:MAG TPA: ribulose-phosphate 3-epimerase [Chloroflexota bacterium]|nr:ribulose-phosphate 3-epimerase [Chloroflexota bacterium]